MSEAYDFVMVDHPAWRPTTDGHRRVFVEPDGGRYLITVASGRTLLRSPLADGRGGEPTPDVFVAPSGALDDVPELASALGGLGSVARFRTACLWEAIGTAIIRQVIRAAQAKKLYRSFCEAYGEKVELPAGGNYALFPTSEVVVDLPNAEFSAIGMAFTRRPMAAAADAYLEYGATWRGLSPRLLIDELQVVPRIGPWTAKTAVVDWSNDWALYPHGDLAVRTWARRAAPSYGWPTDEAAFGRTWRGMTGDQLSSLTLLTLAWGSRHGDIT